MTPNVLDRLVAAKIVWPNAGPADENQIIPCYTQDVESALEAANAFTRRGGNVRMLKTGGQVWEATAWVALKQRQFTEVGTFPSALCRAMLAAVGVSVKSSDG